MSTAVIDEGFRPHLSSGGLSDENKELIELWLMNNEGIPVEARPGSRAALWYGRRPSRYGEVAVVCASVHGAKKMLDYTHTQWFVGAAPERALAEPLLLPDYALTTAKVVNTALAKLALLLPAEHFTS